MACVGRNELISRACTYLSCSRCRRTFLIPAPRGPDDEDVTADSTSVFFHAHKPGGQLVEGVSNMSDCILHCQQQQSCLSLDFDSDFATCWLHGAVTECSTYIAASRNMTHVVIRECGEWGKLCRLHPKKYVCGSHCVHCVGHISNDRHNAITTTLKYIYIWILWIHELLIWPETSKTIVCGYFTVYCAEYPMNYARLCLMCCVLFPFSIQSEFMSYSSAYSSRSFNCHWGQTWIPTSDDRILNIYFSGMWS